MNCIVFNFILLFCDTELYCIQFYCDALQMHAGGVAHSKDHSDHPSADELEIFFPLVLFCSQMFRSKRIGNLL